MATLNATHQNLPGFNPVHTAVPARIDFDAAHCCFGLPPGHTFIITPT
jgi:hypothetical protein